MEYVYDHDGIRVGKTINGTDIFKYIVDKNRPYAQVLEEQWTTGDLSTTTSYVYSENLLSRTTNGTPHYYLYDGMGSTRTLTDMTGAVTDTYQYDAYGNLLDKTGSTINPYLYRSEQYDDDLRAYYLRARYYQPGIGRFLTTDPVEGFPNSPMTLHRYVYGNNAPVNFLDPSGKMSLPEKLVVANVIGILANLAVAAVGNTEWGRNVMYPYLAKHVFPEAYIVGFNITGKIPALLLEYVNTLSDHFPISDYALIRAVSSVFGGFGGELLLSLGSGEAALFKTTTAGVALEVPNISGALDIYDGFVFNLWNANNYRGPFESVSIGSGLEIDGLTINGGLFWDIKDGFRGPWGVATTFFSKSLPPWTQPISLARAKTNYDKLKSAAFDRPHIFGGITAVLAAKNLLKLKGGGVVFALASFEFGVTTWINIGLAHAYWNQKEEKYSLVERRTIDREQVEGGYRSGPTFFGLL